MAERTMAPNLSSSDRLQYIRNEIEEIQEMLDGAEDLVIEPKWLIIRINKCLMDEG
jgi:glutathionylspermidine synthase